MWEVTCMLRPSTKFMLLKMNDIDFGPTIELMLAIIQPSMYMIKTHILGGINLWGSLETMLATRWLVGKLSSCSLTLSSNVLKAAFFQEHTFVISIYS